MDTSLGKDNGEWRSGSRPFRVHEMRIVVLNDGTEQEDRDDVEERDTEQDGVHSLWNMLVRITGLGSRDTNHFRTAIGVTDRNQGRDESCELTLEGSTVNVPGRHAILLATNDASIDQDTTDHEHEDGEDFQDGEPVLDLTVRLDASDIDCNHDKDDDQRNNPYWEVGAGLYPEGDDNSTCGQLGRNGQGPVDEVHPTHLKGQGFVKHTTTPGIEGTGQWKQGGDFTNCLTDKCKPKANHAVCNQSTTWASCSNGLSRGQEETCADSP